MTASDPKRTFDRLVPRSGLGVHAGLLTCPRLHKLKSNGRTETGIDMWNLARLCSVLLLGSLAGCADPFPNESYFDNLVHHQRTLSDGVISFTPSAAWEAWDQRNRSDILGYGLWASRGRCDGQLHIATRVTYSIARPTSGYVIQFGPSPGVVCRVPYGTETLNVRLHPKYAPLPLFDPDEPVGEAEVSIVLMPKVH